MFVWLFLGVFLFSTAFAQLCDQPFSPLREGWVWEYRLLDSKNQPAGTISARKLLSGNSFITQLRGKNAKNEEIKNDTKYTCTPEGIRSAGEGFGGDSINIRRIQVTGIEIPDSDRWEVGANWRQTVELEGDGKLGILPVSGKMILEASYRITAQETVTVPAGRFTAFRVENQSQLKFQTSIPIPIGNQLFKTISWYVEDLGVIKSIFGSGNDQTTSELLRLPKR